MFQTMREQINQLVADNSALLAPIAGFLMNQKVTVALSDTINPADANTINSASNGCLLSYDFYTLAMNDFIDGSAGTGCTDSPGAVWIRDTSRTIPLVAEYDSTRTVDSAIFFNITKIESALGIDDLPSELVAILNGLDISFEETAI